MNDSSLLLPLTDYAAFRALERAVKNHDRRTLTNCFLLPYDLKRHIENGAMYYSMPTDESLILFLDKETHYQAYLYVVEGGEPPVFPALPKPCMVENPYTGDDADHLPSGDALTLSLLLQSIGFTTRRRSHRLEALHHADTETHIDAKPFPHTFTVQSAAIEDAELVIDYARPEHVQAIHQSMHEAFDVLCSYIPSREELLEIIRAQRVVGVFDAENTCFAYLNFNPTKSASTINHLFVSPSLRGMGIATSLLRAYEAQTSGSIRKHALWVDNSNIVARRLYETMGFTYTGRNCEELYLP